MRIGIIAEFNPLHSGHSFLIEQAKNLIQNNNCDGEIIVVMSEFFTQRGEVAIINGYKRGEVAIINGCDLVLALPYRASVSYSDDFAFKSVELLVKCGITHLIFGTESNIEIFENFYKKECELSFTSEIKEKIKSGISYPKIMSELFNISNNNPNFILAYSYYKAIKKLAPHIILIPIKRNGQTLNEEFISDDKFLSATSIRKNYNNTIVKNYLSEEMIHHLDTSNKLNENNFFEMLKYKILSSEKDYLKNIYDVSEGLENRIYECAKSAKNYEELVNNIATKRYSRKKIQRILLHILTNTTKKEMIETINNVRVLAVKKSKTHLISEINANNNDIYIHQKLKKNNEKYFLHDIKVSRIYNIMSEEQDIFKNIVKIVD